MSKFISWMAILVWMAIIFYLSHQPVSISNGLSQGITEVIVEKIERLATNYELNMDHANHLIRKNAHFFIYFVLGLFVSHALRKTKGPRVRHWGIALLICVLFAFSDEGHQYFIEGRGPQLRDVLIDSCGALLGIVLYGVGSSLSNRRRTKKV